jgi:hypothetical protein
MMLMPAQVVNFDGHYSCCLAAFFDRLASLSGWEVLWSCGVVFITPLPQC